MPTSIRQRLSPDLRDLEYLTAVANTGNFGRAAKMLGVSTSSITRRIARLEDELGATLFERSRTGVRLTSGGRCVLVHARRALGELDAVRQVAAGSGMGTIGEVRLGVRLAPIGEPIATLLAEWHDHNPDVLLTVSEMNDRDIAAALVDRRVDVTLVPSQAVWPDAVSIPLYSERLWAAVPARHVLAARESVDWTDLRDSMILLQGWEESQEARRLYASLLGDGIRVRAHGASKQTILALVAAGFGITLTTAGQMAIGFPGVSFKPIEAENAIAHFSLVWQSGLEDPTVGRFVAFLRDRVKPRTLR